MCMYVISRPSNKLLYIGLMCQVVINMSKPFSVLEILNIARIRWKLVGQCNMLVNHQSKTRIAAPAYLPESRSRSVCVCLPTVTEQKCAFIQFLLWMAQKHATISMSSQYAAERFWGIPSMAFWHVVSFLCPLFFYSCSLTKTGHEEQMY